MAIDKTQLDNWYAEVERIKSRLDSLYFKMEEAAEDNQKDVILYRKFVAGKDEVSRASDCLLCGLDELRTS